VRRRRRQRQDDDVGGPDLLADPGRVTAIAFNTRAAEEMSVRLDAALAEIGVAGGTVWVKTFHALGREILRDAGQPVEPLVDRARLLQRLWPSAGASGWRALDTAFSRLKLDLGVEAADVAADVDRGPVGDAFVRYEEALAAIGGLDFDDLVARALRLLETDAGLLARWRDRSFDLLVDEAQDLDRAQLRFALLLAAPANRIFLVGDDDQSIYGWRLADVRRVLSLAESLPGLRRIDLETNYRCPAPVVERSVRLVAGNRERFDKRVRARSNAAGRLVLAPDNGDDVERIARAFASWPADDGTQAVLTRKNRELLPAAIAALDAGIPFRAARLELLTDDPRLDGLLDLANSMPSDVPLPVRLEAIRARSEGEVSVEPAIDVTTADEPPEDLEIQPERIPLPELAAALLAWSLPYREVAELRAAMDAARARLADLRRDDAGLTLATAHSTKGLEFDHVAVLGLDAGRFPSARSLADAPDPDRALEEERRLAYVAWTRARRSLTLIYDPANPSLFMSEAFAPDELDLADDRPDG
jgi:superfamily I DNA/RNA helicase